MKPLRGDSGGAKRDRTADLYNAIVALSQLSYGPNLWKPIFMGCLVVSFVPLTGLSPALRGACACRLGLTFRRSDGAGEGIRTLDPNLGKVVLYP